MNSVCIITYNGEKYIKKQLHSIIKQLNDEDEIIVSDNGSTDKTLEIIKSFNDNRIKIYSYKNDNNNYSGIWKTCYNVGRNAENAIKHAKGDYIFLADQDDIWIEGKLTTCVERLKEKDLVITNHTTVDADLNPLKNIKPNKLLQPTFLNTLLKTQFLGCCMAFRRSLLSHILPFPKEPLMHDIWIGIMAMKYGKIEIIQDSYLLYRRHSKNASTNIEKKSENPLSFKIQYRFLLIKAYIQN